MSNVDERPRTQMSGVLPKVYLVRHGETAWTLSGQHTGRTDIPLTERGERDARDLGARLRGLTWRLFEDGCPGGETLAELSTRADRVIDRIRALESDVLVFAHGHLLRILMARWIALPALEARRLYLETASLSVLGYDHDLDEPVIRLLNDARHA